MRWAWEADAACRGADPNLWFPETARTDDAAAAKKICRTCPVRHQCLEEHLFEHDGIWGAMSNLDRKAERRRRRLTASRPHGDGCGCPVHGGRPAA